MSELLSRAGALFVAPAPVIARPVAAPPPAGLVAVLAPVDVLLAVAGGVAATLRHIHRSRTALVLVPAPLAARRPALPAAQALARRLAERDLHAVAAGAAVRVALTGDNAWRAIAAAAGVPAVIGLSARTDLHDSLLAHADQLLLASAQDDVMTELAFASLAAIGPPAALVTPPGGVVARRLAGVGLTRVHYVAGEVPA